ncbi:hypothetical protein DM01DRAFT_1348747 [Hesseltinella vesiculosa]|uniref:Reverse transcriptase zinc-binding domain-containing protein n=1 Tax=Hesseltinella vesiculosa TaxID=101127 RepID=A0A1X2G787_9FUNG|nr:hypothetical protein DM01DRAFT_1348747 [Hesseltinella vesiculosa]
MFWAVQCLGGPGPAQPAAPPSIQILGVSSLTVFTHTPNWVSLPNRKVGLFRPNGKFVPFEKLAPKDIRRSMVSSQAAHTSSKDHPRLNRPPKDWLAIWSLPFSTPAITIWWRLLHSKIPSRHHLRKHGRPLKDDYCLFCPLVPETDFHLLITCPAKKAIWSCALPDSDTAEIQCNLLSPASLAPSARATYARALAASWSVHWGRTFSKG